MKYCVNCEESVSRRTSSVSDTGGMSSSRSSPGTSTPHVFISSEICDEVLFNLKMRIVKCNLSILSNPTFYCSSFLKFYILFPFLQYLQHQDSCLCQKENDESCGKSNLTDPRRNNWKYYSRHHEPVGLFLLVPAVHTKHTVFIHSFIFPNSNKYIFPKENTLRQNKIRVDKPF